MPQVNLSGLNGSELRQLLDASRRRGDAALSYSVLQEMAARRDGGAAQTTSKTKHRSGQRLVAVDLGEPERTEDDLPPMPNWRPRPPEAGDGAPPPEAEAPIEEMDRPLSFLIDAPAPSPEAPDDLDLRLHAAGPKARPVRRGISLRVFAGFTIGIALGTAFGWWAGGVSRDALPSPALVRTAALAPSPAPPPPPAPEVSEPVPEVHAEPAVEATPEPAARPEPPEPAPEISEPTPAAPVVATGCANQPTPADRAICGDPNLQRLQGELRQAYARALAAHEDRDLLRQRQLAWRDARNTVADPDRLAALYEARIRKLNAATVEARGERYD